MVLNNEQVSDRNQGKERHFWTEAAVYFRGSSAEKEDSESMSGDLDVSVVRDCLDLQLMVKYWRMGVGNSSERLFEVVKGREHRNLN